MCFTVSFFFQLQIFGKQMNPCNNLLHEIRLCANLTYMIRLCAMSYTKLLGKIVEKEGKFGFVSGCSYIIVPCLPTLTT